MADLKIPNTDSQNKITPTETVDESLELEYRDERSVTISPVHNYSNYRKVNFKVMGHKKEVIGSSVKSCQVLSSNAGEVEAYFPALIGLSPNNADFITRVKSYLSNIHFVVNEENTVLNTTFIYTKKKYYLDIKRKEDEINEAYDKIDRNNLAAIMTGLERKITALNTLESSKYKFGHPENINDYLIYRHCLLYKDVAKDTALINGDPRIRFFIKDEAKEQERLKKLTEDRVRAMKAFVELNGTTNKFESVYVAIALLKGDNLSTAILKDRNQKSAIIMDFVNNSPDKFNKLVNDKNIEIKAFIENLIVKGELIRAEHNQQISTADGTFIGSNMNEAIAWFNNPDNAAIRTVFENKLKLSN